MIPIADIYEARKRISRVAKLTPVLTSNSINLELGRKLFFKSEHLQTTGSFKIRGALNAVLQAPENAPGIIGFSSGNHAQGLAYAASISSRPAIVIMPSDSSKLKVEATKRYGAKVVTEGVTVENRYEILSKMIVETGYHPIPPFDDYRVMAGQGTIMLELLEQVSDLDAVLVPVGGGGLISGIASVVKQLKPSIEVIGVEPVGGDDTYQSLQKGERVQLDKPPTTICDGIRTIIPGEKTFPIIQETVDRIIVVPDEATIRAQALIMQRMKQIVEPTAAITLGAVLVDKDLPSNVGLILTGGNWMPQ
ncbi:threonine/serine dehydratase [Candidatus Saccharibacteria bacterium]|nr:threonine/serine dehydratase [Candidatus Saccharibacteria bacterium]MCB9821180.1 threonine/serine dehydratase [Candidatus Nomurabacteria bacterium]